MSIIGPRFFYAFAGIPGLLFVVWCLCVFIFFAALYHDFDFLFGKSVPQYSGSVVLVAQPPDYLLSG